MRSGVLGEFASADEMLEAVSLLERNGYRALETYSPYPVPGAVQRLGLRRSRLPELTFGGGLLGAILGYGIQWYANVRDYPYDVGGRPIHAVPAFVPGTFEAAVLCAALAAFAGLCLAARLPSLWHPVFEAEGFERASIDRFWVGIEDTDRRVEPEGVRSALAALQPVRLLRVESAE